MKLQLYARVAAITCFQMACGGDSPQMEKSTMNWDIPRQESDFNLGSGRAYCMDWFSATERPPWEDQEYAVEPLHPVVLIAWEKTNNGWNWKVNWYVDSCAGEAIPIAGEQIYGPVQISDEGDLLLETSEAPGAKIDSNCPAFSYSNITIKARFTSNMGRMYIEEWSYWWIPDVFSCIMGFNPCQSGDLPADYRATCVDNHILFQYKGLTAYEFTKEDP